VHLPHEAAYFPIFPAIGSVLGCLILYKIVRGGERIIERRFKSDRLDRAKRLFRRWGVLALVIHRLLPPRLCPLRYSSRPRSAWVTPMGRFALLIFVARSIRYYFWAALAYFNVERVRQVFSWLEEHFSWCWDVMIALAALVLIVRWIVIALRNRSLKGRAEASLFDR
jgi:membrane protein DedA with SNARE-associated domain